MPAKPDDEVVTPAELSLLGAAMGCRTQRELAERLGVTQSRISQILSGAYPLKRGTLLTLVRSLQGQFAVDTEKSSRSRG